MSTRIGVAPRPAGEVYPFVYWADRGMVARSYQEGHVAMVETLMEVGAVAPETGYFTALAASNRIFQMLVNEFHPYTNEYGTVLSCDLRRPVRESEEDEDGVMAAHLGGIYRFSVRAVGT